MRSNRVPESVQTGCENGCREREQKLNGRRLKEECTVPAFDRTPEPALAEYASSDAHSEWVIYLYSISVSVEAILRFC